LLLERKGKEVWVSSSTPLKRGRRDNFQELCKKGRGGREKGSPKEKGRQIEKISGGREKKSTRGNLSSWFGGRGGRLGDGILRARKRWGRPLPIDNDGNRRQDRGGVKNPSSLGKRGKKKRSKKKKEKAKTTSPIPVKGEGKWSPL